ncbi:hypothetical protein HPB52_024256 [Rhipicephalus sanguineus]|uniref:60S ribosomal protein L6 n=1 Tax=Rhipicephalus sanguineus TaxID=34632 RepID=A0A9D4PAQ0_RHISA|nr:hypothetical protein HPB52_024256 [Rhipicephalus sanguineus]
MSGKPDPKAKKAPAAAKTAAKGASTVAKGDAAVAKKAHAPRNQKLPGGVWLFSRSKMFHKRGLFKVKHAPVPKEKRKRKKPPLLPYGGQPPAQEDPHMKPSSLRMLSSARGSPQAPSSSFWLDPTVARSSVRYEPRVAIIQRRDQPNTVKYLRCAAQRKTRRERETGTGRHAEGSFLKQLKTGLLMVTGPYGINGCPLRRINQIYVIATSTKIDISSVKLPENLDDRFFNRPKSVKRRSRKDEGEIFDTKPQERTVSDEHRKVQKEVDKQVLEAGRSTPRRGPWCTTWLPASRCATACSTPG